MPKERRALSRKSDSDSSKVCLDAWRSFVQSQSEAVAILDGYAFQNTVRFLFEQRVSSDEISRYFNLWQELAPDTSITYLSVENPSEHYESVLPERGEDWTRKLFAWIERTPIGIGLKLHGKSGFVKFWSIYQELCLDLLHSAFIDVQLVEARSWDDTDLEDLARRRSFL